MPKTCSILAGALLLGANLPVFAQGSPPKASLPVVGGLFSTQGHRVAVGAPRAPIVGDFFGSGRIATGYPAVQLDRAAASLSSARASTATVPSFASAQALAAASLSNRPAVLQRGITLIPPPKNQGKGIPNSAVGDLSYNETTGIINIPAAKVAPPGSIMLAIEWQDTTFPGVGLYTSRETGPRPFDLGNGLFQDAGDYRILAGIGNNIELSYMNLHFGINDPIFGVKWLPIQDDSDHPAFGIGVQSIGLKAQNAETSYAYPHPAYFDHPSLFGVVGHTFSLNDDGMTLELEGGWGTGRLKNGFIGGEFHFNKVIGLAAEYDGTIESYALKIFPSDRFTILVDAQAQVPYRFGMSFRYQLGRATPRGAPAWAVEQKKSRPDKDDDDDDD